MKLQPPSTTLRKRLVLCGVAGLLALQWWLAVGSKFEASCTSDELIHLTGGLCYWELDDFRMHPENGNLPQRWAALPAWLSGARLPPAEGTDWQRSVSWNFGYDFFFSIPGQDHFPLLMYGRAMIALFLTATSLLVFFWARSLWGLAGGCVALVFCAFSPHFLAHGALATSDICMTFFFLAATGAYWRHLHDQRIRWWTLSALAFGLACVTKFSAVLLLPMMVAMSTVRWLSRQPVQLANRTFTTPISRAGALAGSLLVHAVAAVGIIWLFYGLRFQAGNPQLPAPEHFLRPWEWIDQNIGLQGRIVRLIGAARLLPEAFLYGYAYVIESAQVRSAFLDGAYSYTGWVSFFPKAFLYKSTPSLLLALLTSTILVALWIRKAGQARLRAALYRVTPLLVLFIGYWAASLTSHLNIGHRHILPTYPALFIFCGTLGWAAVRARRQAWSAGIVAFGLVAALAGGQVLSAAGIHPFYLAYFSPLVGGPEKGNRHLVDSSLDWGQDLPGLKRWLQHNAANQPVFLSYFGTSEPGYYEIKATRLPCVTDFGFKPRWYDLGPGIYCISATMLSHVYSPTRDEWSVELEKEYQSLRAVARQVASGTLPADSNALAQACTRFNQLRFARLCHYLRVREADDRIGYSILIFRLSAAEIERATESSLLEWAKLIEQTLQTKA